MLLNSVIGCHRSHDLDVTVDNPRGYFESTLLRSFNDRLLESAGFAWDRPPLGEYNWRQGRYMMEAIRVKNDFKEYSLRKDWIDKDPRLSITLPIYDHILLERRPTAVSVRPPTEVQSSLYYRDGFSESKGLLLWFLYNRSCTHFIREGTDLLVSFPELVNGDETTLGRIEKFLRDSSYILKCSTADLRESIVTEHKNNTDRKLRRRNQNLTDRDGGMLLKHCQMIYEQVELAQWGISAYQEAFEVVPSFVIDMYHAVLSEGEPSLECCRRMEQRGISVSCSTGDSDLDNELITSYSDLILAMQTMRDELKMNSLENVDALKQRITDMENSTSWRSTSWLRWIASAIKT